MNKRQDTDNIIGFNGSVTKACKMLFGLLMHDAYIGRFYQYLICLMNLDLNMLTPIILYYALVIGGQNLKRFYPKFFRDLCQEILKPTYINTFETYLKS